jgi:hypothetical protein
MKRTPLARFGPIKRHPRKDPVTPALRLAVLERDGGSNVLDRLYARVEKSEGCWEWTGPLSLGGRYGGIRRDGRTSPVHRVAWEAVNGPVPAGLELDHLCRNHRCVRPDHLEAVTHLENMRRGSQAQKKACDRHGLPLVQTVYGRSCQECRREDRTNYRRRHGGGTVAKGRLQAWAGRSPERRAEISRKIWETRRRNAAS